MSTTTAAPDTPLPAFLADHAVFAMCLGVAFITLIAAVIFFVKSRGFRIFATVALIISLGYLVYIGHKESIHDLTNKATDMVSETLRAARDIDTTGLTDTDVPVVER